MGEADVKRGLHDSGPPSGCATPKDNGMTSCFPLKSDLAVLGDKEDRGGPPVPSVALGSLNPREEETSVRHSAGPVAPRRASQGRRGPQPRGASQLLPFPFPMASTPAPASPAQRCRAPG